MRLRWRWLEEKEAEAEGGDELVERVGVEDGGGSRSRSRRVARNRWLCLPTYYINIDLLSAVYGLRPTPVPHSFGFYLLLPLPSPYFLSFSFRHFSS